MTIKKLEHVGLMVANIEQSIAFYTDVLGLKYIRTIPHTNGEIKLAFLGYPNQHDIVLELIEGYNSHLPVEGKVHHIAFTVTDIHAEFERLKARTDIELKDTELTILPDGSSYFFFYGPDGELLELFEPGEVKPYPLLFEASFKERVWGGQALRRFGLTIPTGAIGEGWMISDHPNGITVVKNGALAGTPLDVIRETYGKTWFGEKGLQSKSGRFPLLIKLLDCNDDLSVQVHPNDDYENLPSGELGKTEMWYILSAEPDSKIVYGLKENTSREQLLEAIEQDQISDYLYEVKVKAGDAFYIPAGTVHALCSGVVVAEIQQNSDTTYRLYDYNRPGLDGSLRELHIEDSINVINFDNDGAAYVDTTTMKTDEWLTIASSPYFVVAKGIISKETTLSTSHESFDILVIAEGQGEIVWGSEQHPLQSGQCYLIPAELGEYKLQGEVTVLRCYIP